MKYRRFSRRTDVSEAAALDVGANHFVVCTTTTGSQWLYYIEPITDRLLEGPRSKLASEEYHQIS
jgi:hypothetical protein